MMLDAAEKHFKQVLALKDVDARTRSRTKLHLQEIATVRKALAAAQTRASPPEKPEAERTAKPANPAPSAPSPQAATARTGDGGWKAPAGWA